MVVPHEVVGDGGEGRAMKQGEVRRDGVKLWHWLPSFPFPERVSINFFFGHAHIMLNFPGQELNLRHGNGNSGSSTH